MFVYKINDNIPGIGLVVSRRITETPPLPGEFVPIRVQEYRIKNGEKLAWLDIDTIRTDIRAMVCKKYD